MSSPLLSGTTTVSDKLSDHSVDHCKPDTLWEKKSGPIEKLITQGGGEGSYTFFSIVLKNKKFV